VAKTAVWRWQERFMLAGVDGLLRDKTREWNTPRLTTGGQQFVHHAKAQWEAEVEPDGVLSAGFVACGRTLRTAGETERMV
jgi:hypothetical protein